MKINSARFITSSVSRSGLPPSDKPEFAFIGRSNVGKSSLINRLTGQKKLAKTSRTPGKTQTINHFLINEAWHLVDLPGYGYASVSRTSRSQWQVATKDYLLNREVLYCVFVLIDARHDPQPSDVAFLTWLGTHHIPPAIALTKLDKLSPLKQQNALHRLHTALLPLWEECPPIFLTSAETGAGKEALINFIGNAIKC